MDVGPNIIMVKAVENKEGTTHEPRGKALQKALL